MSTYSSIRIPPYRIVRDTQSGCVAAVKTEGELGEGMEVIMEHIGGPGYGGSLVDVGIMVLAGDMFSAGASWARANPDKPVHSISSLMLERVRTHK